MFTKNRDEIESFIGDDGAVIRELASPQNSPLTRHSLAEIRHPPGTVSHEHYHTEAEEVYYVVKGRGRVRVDGESRDIGPGDVVVIVPGQRHKVWQVGEGDLVMLVTCVPAYSVEEVTFDEQPEGPGGLPKRGKSGRRDQEGGVTFP